MHGRYVYFLYSAEQRKLKSSIESSGAKKYQGPSVLVNGKWKEYTEMNTTGENRFSDSYIVAEGYYNLMKIKSGGM